MANSSGPSKQKRITRKIVWWVALALTPFAFVALLDRWFESVAASNSVWQVRRISIVASSASFTEQLPELGWQAAELPNFAVGDRVQPPTLWYRADVPVTGDSPREASWAIYIVGPSADYSAFVNGHFVGESGQLMRPMPQHTALSFFRFPSNWLRPGHNAVEIRCSGERSRTVLQSIQIGPNADLSRSYSSAVFAVETVKQITAAGLVALGLVMLVLARSRSREAIFGWYAIALFFMSAHVGIRTMPSFPFGNAPLWRSVIDSTLAGYIVCAVCSVNRFVGIERPRFEKWWLYWGFFGLAAMTLDPLLFDSKMPWFFNRIWLPVILPICVYQTWRLIRVANETPSFENRLLALVTFTGLVVGSCDGLIGAVSLSSTIYLPYTMGPALCAYGLVLLRRFVQASKSAELARFELELRVEEKTKELEESLVRMKDLEREQALSAERERIMRDMHDGVGSQLVQALSIATRHPELKPIEEPLRSCLQELRLIIDSIEAVDGNLASVLGTLRFRMSRSLTQAGINLRWKVDDIPILADFGPNRVLHVSRIVHEAIANALKHSCAKQITLSARLDMQDARSRILIEIADDGDGIKYSAESGRGLDNMRRRASDLNAQLSIDSCPRGTTVRLILPVNETMLDDANTNGVTIREHAPAQVPNLATPAIASST